MISWKALLIACAIGVPGVSAVAQSVTDLPRAKTCARRSTIAQAGHDVGTTVIRMTNDGGWCWLDLFAVYASMQYVPTFRVARAPAHGELLMGTVEKRARVAYRPSRDFEGEDSYVLMGTLTNAERVVTITISR
jgi:hypothetical protein